MLRDQRHPHDETTALELTAAGGYKAIIGKFFRFAFNLDITEVQRLIEKRA